MQRIATLSHAKTSEAGLLELSVAKMRLLWGNTEEKRADPAMDIMKEASASQPEAWNLGLGGV